jgi:enoyl-CoA hydratase/carnithine racemase
MAALQRERVDGAIEVLRLDRPDARNALDSAAFRELSHTAEHVARENLGLVEWQRTGVGLPQGGLRR